MFSIAKVSGCRLDAVLFVLRIYVIADTCYRITCTNFEKKSFELTQQTKLQRQIPTTLRSFSSTAATSTGGGGAGFFARVGSFISGAGLTALATEFYIFQEVREGNAEMLKKQRELEKRLAALEKKH